MSSVLHYLKEISSAVMFAAEATEIEDVLERIAAISRELVSCKYAALGIPDGEGGLRYFKTAGVAPEIRGKIGQHPEGRGLIGAIMRERRTIRLSHLEHDSRSEGFPSHHPIMDSFLGVPVAVGNQLYGMLYLCDRDDGQPFDDDDQLLIEMMAGYAAMAIAGVEFRQQESRLKLLEERERIAMELHDGIIQSLYGMGMQVELLRQNNETITPQELLPMIGQFDEVIEDIRHYISKLRQRDEGQATILACLEQIKQRLHPPNDLAIHIKAPDSKPPFSPSEFESICLIVNEALSNAIRHSDASKISVQVRQANQLFVIEVVDDGQGFDVQVVDDNHNGLGLRNIRHRARLYGGEVKIDSNAGEGTCLTIEIPIRAY